MSFYTGTGASAQFGKESVFGTSVVPTSLINLTSESMKLTVNKSDEGSLLASKTAMSRDLLDVTVDGSIDFILRPEFAGLLFQSALGGSDTVTDNSVTGYFDHTINLAAVSSDLPSITVVIGRKAAVKKYAGCTISTLSLDCAANDYVKGTIEVKGVNEEEGTLATLASYTIPSYRCTSATFTVGGTSYDISSSSFKIDNALEDAPKTYSSGLYASQPQHGIRSTTISFDMPYSNSVETLKSTLLTTETNSAIVLTFTSTDSNYKIKITMPNVAIDSCTNNVTGTGVITASLSGVALSSGSTEPLSVVITDATQTAYGA